jgi:hypothetical protein
VRVGEGELDGLRWRGRLAPQERGIELKKGGDDFPPTVQRCPPDEPNLKVHAGPTKQPWLTLQSANKRRQFTVLGRAPDLLHDKRLPRSERCLVHTLFDEVLDEGEAAQAFIDVFAEFYIERGQSVQQ